MSLLAWFQFENNVKDSSMYEWSSSFVGTSIYEQGPIGKSIYFSSYSHITAYIDKNLYVNGALSISMFVFIRPSATGSALSLFGTFDGSSTGFFTYNPANTNQFKYSSYYRTTSNTVTEVAIYSNPLPINKWTHLCYTRDNKGTIKAYIDGQLANTATTSTFQNWVDNTSYKLAIGGIRGDSTLFNSRYVNFCDVKIFNHELSAKEIEILSRAKIFHVDFEDTCDSIAGRIATASIASGVGYLHNTTGSSQNSSRVGDSVLEINSTTNALNYGSPSILQYDQSASGHTFIFWYNPKNYANPKRQNPMAKAYGGEGTITFENTGWMNLYWGTSGYDSSPYTNNSGPTGYSTNGTWTHIAMVRDRIQKNLKVYINGQYNSTPTLTAGWLEPKYGTQSFYLYDGYVNYFNGYLDDFRIYATPLSGKQIYEIYSAKAYLTNVGSYSAKGSIKNIDFYHGFEGSVSDSRAFIYDIGGGTMIWGYTTGSRKTLYMKNDSAGYDFKIKTVTKFKKSSILYAQIYSKPYSQFIIGFSNTGSTSLGLASYDYSIFFNAGASTFNIRAYSKTTAVSNYIYPTSSNWIDIKIEFLKYGGAKYWYKDSIDKDWIFISSTSLSYDSGRDCHVAFTGFGNISESLLDNLAVSSVDNKISYYGDINSNDFDEFGRTKDLVASWLLNYTTASYSSASGNMYPLTASTSIVNYTTGPNQLYGAVYLNYTASNMNTEYFTFPKMTFVTSLQQKFTFMAWIYLSGSNYRHQTIIGDTQGKSKIGVNSNGKFYYTTSETFYITSSESIPMQKWTHVCYANGGYTFLYINGKLVASTGNSYTQSFDTIGAASSSVNTRFKGIISDVRIYSDALSESEINKIYQLGNPESSLLINSSSTIALNFGENY